MLDTLVEVLTSVAANWRICACAYKIGVGGRDGWDQRKQRLEGELELLQNEEVKLLKAGIRKLRRNQKSDQSKLKDKQAEIKSKRDAIKAIESEWKSVGEEYRTCEILFCDARKFCVQQTGVGDDELFHAALVGFDASQLKRGHPPSRQNLPDIVTRLGSLSRGKWAKQPWAKPVSPSTELRLRVTPEMLRSFTAEVLERQLATADATEKTADGNGKLVPRTRKSLCELDELVLLALGELKAFNKDNRRTAEQVANHLDPKNDRDYVKKPLAKLKQLKLVDSHQGQKGGSWLTAKGKQRFDRANAK